MQRQLSFDELMQLLNHEIEWCIDHPARHFTSNIAKDGQQ